MSTATYCSYCCAPGTERVDATDFDAQAAELARVREALGEYGRHPERCNRWFVVDPEAEDGQLYYATTRKCTCGLDAALKGATP
jgi:hypothetical protein